MMISNNNLGRLNTPNTASSNGNPPPLQQPEVELGLEDMMDVTNYAGVDLKVLHHLIVLLMICRMKNST